MMIGEYEVKLTDKNRLALPKRFREEFGSQEIIISRGYEDCLLLLNRDRWDQLVANIKVKPILEKNVRASLRFILGGAQQIELDSQGRFVVSQNYLEFAEIKESVVFVGVEDWLEIWDSEKWKKYLTNLNKTADDVAQRLIEINDKA